jgi:hypothetical protein
MNALADERKLRIARPLATPDIILPRLRPGVSVKRVARAIINDPMVTAALGLSPMSTPQTSFMIEIPLKLPSDIRNLLRERARGSDYSFTLKIGEGNELLLVIAKKAKGDREASGSRM